MESDLKNNESDLISFKDSNRQLKDEHYLNDKENNDDVEIKKENLIVDFIKHFKKVEKVAILQHIDYSILFSSTLSSVKYVLEVTYYSGKTHKICKARDKSSYIQRNCIR